MTRITPREWENLSAYLDQQLSEKERTRLESRLQGNSELRTALEELRRTRLILRSQPRLRAPRNFTLTAEMLAKPSASAKPAKRTAMPPMPRAYPALRFASALASILLVLVVLGDVLSGAPAIPMYNRAAAPAAVEQAAPTEQAPEVMMQKSAPTEAAAAVASGAFLAPTEQPAPEATNVPGGGARTMLALTPTPIATSAPPSLAMESVQATPGPDATAVSLMTGPAAGDTAEQPEAALQAPSAEDAQPVGNLVRGSERLLNQTTLRVLEIGLALLAIGTGLLAVYMRRTVR